MKKVRMESYPDLDKFFKEQNKKVKLAISSFAIFLLLFLSIAFLSPFKNNIFNRLFPKPFSRASTLTPDDWPQLGHDQEKSNATASNPPSGPYRFYFRWTGVPLASRAQPVVVNGILYIGGLNGTFYALNATADNQGAQPTILWSRVLNTYDPSKGYTSITGGDPIRAGAGVDSSTATVIVGTQHGTIYGLDTLTGAIKWTLQTGGAILSSPVLDENGKAYLGSSDGFFYALNTSDGSLLWKQPLTNTITDPSNSANTTTTPVPILGSAALSTDGTKVYFVAENAKAYALSTSNGSIVWQTQLQGQSDEGRWPVVYNNSGTDEVFFRTQPVRNFSTLLAEGDTALDSISSTVNPNWITDWQQNAKPGILNYLNSTPNAQTLFVLNGSTGQPVANSPAPVLYTFGDNDAPSPPTIYSGKLYISYRPRHGIQTDGGSTHVSTKYDAELGAMDPSSLDISDMTLATSSASFSYQFRLTSDEPSVMSMAGNVLFSDNWERLGGIQITNQTANAGNLVGISQISINSSCGLGANDLNIQFYTTCPSGNNLLGANNGQAEGNSRAGAVVSSGRIFWKPSNGGLGAIGPANGITDTNSVPTTDSPVAPSIPGPVATPSAQTLINNYVWTTPTRPIANPPADLVANLSTEITKIVDSNQHLLPLYIERGDEEAGSWPPDTSNPPEPALAGNAREFWFDQGDLIYSLSLAYPYVNTTLQGKLKSYIQNQIINLFPPLSSLPFCCWTDPKYDWQNNGQPREPYPVPTTVRSKLNTYPFPEPPIQTLYALWAYGNYTGDWSYIDAQWQAGNIQSLFTAKTNPVSSTTVSATSIDSYARIAGAIGYARIAQHEGDNTQATNGANAAAAAMLTGINNYSNWLGIANILYQLPNSGYQSFQQLGDRAPVFFGLVPEVGKYLHDTNLAAADTTINYTSSPTMCPFWYFTRLGSECEVQEASYQPPYIAWSLFLAQAYINGANQTQLRYWLDRPWGIGDPWYIQKLVATIEAPGSGSVTPTLTPTSTPILSPTPTTIPTPTATPSAAPSPTLTPTPSITVSPTATPSAAPSPTPTSTACSITSASWNNTSVQELIAVGLTVTATGNCSSSQVNTVVYKSAGLGGLGDIQTTYQPPVANLVFNSGSNNYQATASWIAEAQVTSSSVYYFKANIVGNTTTVTSNNLTVNQTPPAGSGPVIGSVVDNTTTYTNSLVSQYDKFELTFNVSNTVATNLQIPYDSNTPPGLKGDNGISVDGLFSTDNWNTYSDQPGFLYQDYDRSQVLAGGLEQEHLYPKGNPVWKIRYAPKSIGVYHYKIKVTDASGTTYYPSTGDLTFNSTNPTPGDHGFIQVSTQDKRYFQFSDGTPFVGLGTNTSFSSTYDADAQLLRDQQNGVNFLRAWMSGSDIAGSAWSPWIASGVADYGGYLTDPGLVPAPAGSGYDYTFDLEGATNPSCIFDGFSQGPIAVKPSTTYKISITARLDNVTGPKNTSNPNFGLTAKVGPFVNNCPGDLTGVANILPYSQTTNGAFTTISANYTTGAADQFLSYQGNPGELYIMLDNTTGGTAHVAQISLQEVLAGGSLGPNILAKGSSDADMDYNLQKSWDWDYIFDTAAKNNIYIKTVVLEKNDRVWNEINPDGTLDPSGGNNNNFYSASNGGFNKARRLEEYYFRYLAARWGYTTGVHSWELLNEGDPYNGNHYNLAEDFAKYMHQNEPDRHLVTTSFWAGMPIKEFWGNSADPDIDYTDLHAYISTGALGQQEWSPPSGDSWDQTINSSASPGGSIKVLAGSPSNPPPTDGSLVIKGQGNWTISVLMKVNNYTGSCPYSAPANMAGPTLFVQLDGGNTRVIPYDSSDPTKYFICTNNFTGTQNWTQFFGVIPVADDNYHNLTIAFDTQYATTGTAWFDNLQITGPNGQKFYPLGNGSFDTDPRLDNDTADFTSAYSLLYGGNSASGSNKPLVRGETGIDSPGNQVELTALAQDTTGVWLHNFEWGQINPGGMYDLYWWIDNINKNPGPDGNTTNGMYEVFKPFANFMSGIPLNNGHYQDVAATTSDTNLRAWGQKDTLNGRAHLWIQNINHTWNNVINNVTITPVSGTVSFGSMPQGAYTATWYNTTSGAVITIQNINTDVSGNITLTLPAALSSDIAVKVDSATSLSSCNVTGASWNIPNDAVNNTVLAGEAVGLTVTGQGNCNGQNISLNIWKDNGGVGDSKVTTTPITASFNGISASQSWLSLYLPAGTLGIGSLGGSNPAYYFLAALGTDPSVKSASPEVQVAQAQQGTPTPTPTQTLTPVPTNTSTPTSSPTTAPTATVSPSPTPGPTYTVSGTVFIDSNNNQNQDAGESGQAGATVTINGNGVDQSTLSNNLGIFSFSNIPGGASYTVSTSVPVGYVATTPSSQTVSTVQVTQLRNEHVDFGIISSNQLSATPTPNPNTVPKYGVYESTFAYSTSGVNNPWEDVTVVATFTAPSGKKFNINGFYYDVNTYKLRFSPSEVGAYTYSGTISGPSGSQAISGSFTAVASSSEGIPHPLTGNPQRLVFNDGNIFNGIGFNDCWGIDPNNPAALDKSNFIASGIGVNAQSYFATYASAGFNLLRWNPNNCSFPELGTISTSGNSYLVNESKAGDQLLQTAKANGFHVLYTFFTSPPDTDAATNPSEQAAIERYFQYVMARFGPYIDFWELGNETEPPSPPAAWFQTFASYLQTNDPYKRIVTNSNPQDNDWTYLDARSPHFYYKESEFSSDTTMASWINSTEYNQGVKLNKPIIIGEQGNGGNPSCNWDPTSALRMRIRNWSAFFNEGYVIFWNSSANQTYCPNGASNIYLGDQERSYVKPMQDFTAGTDPNAVITPLNISNGSNINAYGLVSSKEVLGYFHHFSDHTNPVTTQVTFNSPISGTAIWMDPATGNILSSMPVTAGSETLTSPSFIVDLALKVTSSTSPSPTPTPSYTVSGTVYVDANGNGFQDSGEVGHGGVTVTLSGQTTLSATTDTNGNYSFTNVGSGSYSLSVVTPSGYTATTSTSMSIPNLTQNTTFNVGIIPTPAPTPTSTIVSPTSTPSASLTPTGTQGLSPTYIPVPTNTPTPAPNNQDVGGGNPPNNGGGGGGGGGNNNPSTGSSNNGPDINHDGKVDVTDLSILLRNFGTGDPSSDLNHDGIVDITDLSILLRSWTG